jgi:hypothetical protein
MSKCLPRFLFIPLDFRFSEFGHFQNNPKKDQIKIKKRSKKDQKKIKKRSRHFLEIFGVFGELGREEPIYRLD